MSERLSAPVSEVLIAAAISERWVGREDFTLLPDDPCFASLEAYKKYMAPLLDDYWHVKKIRSTRTG
jgi:hypothetical protein